MDNFILHGFLIKGLIDVGGDDAKLEKLSQAAKDLASALKKKPSKALSYSLIAFDPEAPENDPVVQEALAALQKRWATYRNTFATMPISVVRAILLDAIVEAASNDDRVGVCFVASARNALPLLPVDNERDIWIDIVKQIESRVDTRAVKEWATPESISVQPLKYTNPDIDGPKISISEVSEEYLRNSMKAAAGPQASAGATQGNQFWPNSNAQWNEEFGNRSGTAIAGAINSALSNINVSQADLSTPFSGMAEAISDFVGETLKSFSAATAGLQRRTNLLWWREALYSPSAAKSYRELSPTTAAALMALDLFETVPLFTPASVSAFLGETVLSLNTPDVGAKKSVRELVEEAQDHVDLAALRAVAAKIAEAPEGRGPLLSLIGHPEHANARNADDFQRLTGYSPSSELDAVSWASWIFRELQASQAANDALPTKRRSPGKS